MIAINNIPKMTTIIILLQLLFFYFGYPFDLHIDFLNKVLVLSFVIMIEIKYILGRDVNGFLAHLHNFVFFALIHRPFLPRPADYSYSIPSNSRDSPFLRRTITFPFLSSYCPMHLLLLSLLLARTPPSPIRWVRSVSSPRRLMLLSRLFLNSFRLICQPI